MSFNQRVFCPVEKVPKLVKVTVVPLAAVLVSITVPVLVA